MNALGASESLTSVSSAKIGSPGTLESVASVSHKSEKSEREFELERIIAFLEENNLKGTMKSLLKELEAKPTPSKTSRVEQKTSSQPELVLSASLSSTKLTQSTDDARIVTGINSSLDLRSPIANKTSEPRTLSFSNEVGKNSGADDNFVMRESKSSNKGQNEYYESSAAFPTNTRKDSVHEVSEMETTEQGGVLARQPVTSGEDSILRRLRDLVSDMGAACFQKVMPSDSSMRMILPTLPEIIPADPSPIDGTHINTWTKGDLGYLPVVCPTLEEEARELWPLDEHGNALMTPYFPAGAGLSAAKVVTTLCVGASQLQRAPSVSQPCPYVRHAVPPRQPNQPPQLEVFDLKVIYEVGRTGFEEHKDFPIVPNSLIANRYQVLEYIGSAAFSRAVHCLDLKTDHQVCIKIIRNSKDFFDQSLDEIKLLQYVNTAGDADENCVVQLYDYFYYREHLFLVCELLKDNLYEFSKYNMEHPEEEFYFTLPRMQKITRSILLALKFIHALNLMHCDLKPENILIRSYSRCEIKVIDFGSSCFITDHLSSYIQSRCYRAPEVIIGMPYDQRIDIWSLGCILPELLTGQVLFLNDSVPQMLARIASLCGSYTPEMLAVARHAARFFTLNGVVYERKDPDGPISYLYSKPTALSSQLGSEDPLFIDFVTKCLTLDYTQRPTAEELLNHPFILADYGPIV